MYLVYYDESGDDGLPGASELFVLTALRVHDSDYRNVYEEIKLFRSTLRKKYAFPSRSELHTRELLLHKKPYVALNLPEHRRLDILDEFINFVPSLPLNFTNIVINKPKIQRTDYDVLDKALTYSIQRIENTIKRDKPGEFFLIITDDGRVEKMRRTSRRLQKINYIPNSNGLGYSNKPIQGLIEDPLPKPSDQSYFIQYSDMVSYLISLYMRHRLGIDRFPSKLPTAINYDKLVDWLTVLKPILNVVASRESKFGFGIVCYPK
ncbi:MAG: DUF3800 domain-containing protein [Chloroflexi bacterium]|nr:DUF3800 domain-containing protein [Chloroflexota bacterium]